MALAALLALWSASPAWAANPAASDQAKQTWQLLDYLAVDYGGAVSDGQIQKASEYEEMKEFAATAAQQLTALPSTPALPDLQRQAQALGDLIAAKADAKAVAGSAHALVAAALLQAGELAAGSQYLASQGRERGRNGQVQVQVDAQGQVWIGGSVQPVINGHIHW